MEIRNQYNLWDQNLNPSIPIIACFLEKIAILIRKGQLSLKEEVELLAKQIARLVKIYGWDQARVYKEFREIGYPVKVIEKAWEVYLRDYAKHTKRA